MQRTNSQSLTNINKLGKIIQFKQTMAIQFITGVVGGVGIVGVAGGVGICASEEKVKGRYKYFLLPVNIS